MNWENLIELINKWDNEGLSTEELLYLKGQLEKGALSVMETVENRVSDAVVEMAN